MPVTGEIQASSQSARRTLPPRAYPAEKARTGDLVLKSRLSRIVFLVGLFGGLLLMAVVLVYLAVAA